MTTLEASGMPSPTLFFLHYLGGSAREWKQARDRLGARYRSVAIDLPGFGDANAAGGYPVSEMADYVERKICEAAPARWMLVGHSMGAKIAAVIARRIEDASIDAGLVGLALIAGSPPSPEPMSDEQRDKMLSWFAGGEESNRADARAYVAANSGAQLQAAWAESAVVDVVRANRAAWRAWLTGGSREDWSERVAVLQTPAIIIAGADDENLGPATQRDLMAPHFAHVTSTSIRDAKHLLPMETPARLAILLEDHLRDIARGEFGAPSGLRSYYAMIDSDRASTVTRHALVRRAVRSEAMYEPVALDGAQFSTLRAVVARVVPTGDDAIALAARIDAQLDEGPGDGWRFANLPPDAQAYRAALFTLDSMAKSRYHQDFVTLDAQQQDELLEQIAKGKDPSPQSAIADAANADSIANAAATATRQTLSAAQMHRWFEDMHADAVKLYVAHPNTLARIGYSGVANGGDGEPKSGFVDIGYGKREAWEPIASPERNT